MLSASLASFCPRTIDEPVQVLGLDGEDWVLAGGVTGMAYALTTAYWAAAVLVVSLAVLRLVKRGQPPGALLHTAWLLGVRIPGWPPGPPPEGQRYSAWR